MFNINQQIYEKNQKVVWFFGLFMFDKDETTIGQMGDNDVDIIGIALHYFGSETESDDQREGCWRADRVQVNQGTDEPEFRV